MGAGSGSPSPPPQSDPGVEVRLRIQTSAAAAQRQLDRLQRAAGNNDLQNLIETQGAPPSPHLCHPQLH